MAINSELGVFFFSFRETEQSNKIVYYLNENGRMVWVPDPHMIDEDENYKNLVFRTAKKITNRSWKLRQAKLFKRNYFQMTSNWIPVREFSNDWFKFSMKF